MKRMINCRTFLCLLIIAWPAAAKVTPPPDDARDLVRRSLDAMGGEERFRLLHVVELKAIGHRQALEQSERPEGPWLVQYEQVTETRDFDRGRLRDEIDARGYETGNWSYSADWTHSSTVVEDGLAFNVSDPQHPAPGRGRSIQLAEESLAFGPERLLLNALGAADLKRDPDAMLHGFMHHVVHFSRGGTLVRIWISPTTYYPAAIDLTRPRPYDIFWSPWGDVTTRITWNFWTLESNGIHFPREWTWESNGLPERSLSVHEIHWNGSTDAFPDLAPVRELAKKRLILPDDYPFASTGPVEVAKDVIQLPGSWNVALIRQADGIVIVEGPVANGYSSRVIDEAQKRFPALPVKAVITTSDSWPHIGGLREYIARGVEIVALDLNEPILGRLAGSPHHTVPDALQKHPRPPKFHPVRSRERFGTMELIPLRTVTGERQMVIWFPATRVLYTSDLFSKQSDGKWFTPQYLSEIAAVVEPEHIEPLTIFGMHYAPTPWKEVVDALKVSTEARLNK